MQPTLSAYENEIAPFSRATMLLKAVELPKLIRASMTQIDSENKIALTGIGVPIVTTYIGSASCSKSGYSSSYLSKPTGKGQTTVAGK